MKYNKTIKLKNDNVCTLRNAMENDAENIIIHFNKIHGETDYLLCYADEHSMTIDEEKNFLKEKLYSDKSVFICAIVDGKIVGSASFQQIGAKYKIKHRAELAVAIEKDYWNMGIGEALIKALIECAKEAGYLQLELSVVKENKQAITLYEKLGFVKYGINPKGFNSRITGYQELVLMYLSL